MKIQGGQFLVTGGSGFVGSHVVEELLRRGAGRVVLFDQVLKYKNLAHFHGHPSVELVEANMLNGPLPQSLEGIDGVFHLATLPLGDCATDPHKAFEVNIRGTFRVIEQAMEAGVRKLVYASASSVYGETPEVMDEQHPLTTMSMYGVSKLCGELLLRPFYERLSYNILRYMNVYGPRQSVGLIPETILKVKAGEAPVVMGDGTASFDFVHVNDVARCTCLAMETEVSGEAFNVGSGAEVTVNEIVAHIQNLAGTNMTPVYREVVPGGMTRRVGNPEKAKRILGFEPTIALHNGLAELVRES